MTGDKNNKKSAVITGATGVIGMALIKKLTEENISVIVLANPNSCRLDQIPNDSLVSVIKCSTDDYQYLELPYSADLFFHLAWNGTHGEFRNDLDLQLKNVKYTLDAVRLAKKIGCSVFVGVGSQAEYGRVCGLLKADTPTNPENSYGSAKLEAGIQSRKLCKELGIKHIWARVLSVYGPYDGEYTMISTIISKFLNNRKPSLTQGEQLWDYIYADDAAEMLYSLAESGKNGHVYPIGSGNARPLKEYVEIIRDAINPDLEIGFGDIPYSDTQVMHLCADISDVKKDTGYIPQTSFEDGSRQTINYFKNTMMK